MQCPNKQRTKGQAMIKHEKPSGELMWSGSVTVIRYAHSHKIRKPDSVKNLWEQENQRI